MCQPMPERRTDLSGPVALGDPERAGDAARRAASPAHHPGLCRRRPYHPGRAGSRIPGERRSSAIPSQLNDYQSLCPTAVAAQGCKSLNFGGLFVDAGRGWRERLQRFATEGLAEVANDCAGERPILLAGERSREAARRHPQKRSPPCVWPRGPAPLSARASSGTR